MKYLWNTLLTSKLEFSLKCKVCAILDQITTFPSLISVESSSTDVFIPIKL